MTEARPARGFATRVLGAVVLILVLGGVLVAASTFWTGRQAARQSYDRILLGAANGIAESISIQGGAPYVDLPVSAFVLLAQAPEDRVYYSVRGPGNRYITGLDATALVEVPPANAAAPHYFDTSLNDEPARVVQVTRRFAEREFSGDVVVFVGQTTRARQAMAMELMLEALVPMVFAGLVLLVISWIVIRSALRPLDALTDDLARRDPYDLTPMPADRLPRELQVMLAAMNRFMGRLDRQVDAMRNLISDTAHQLRTPVAAIRVQAESALDAPDIDAKHRALARLLARTRSLGTLLDQLLSRAMVIHRTDSAPRVALDLRAVALDVVEQRDHELLAPGAEVRLEIGEAPVMVRADAFSLEEAARNLLVNGLKHGQPPVTVGADRRGDSAVLWVRDSGPGPDAGIASQLGDRFARSAGSKENSTGLGLSIVKAVAEAFGGSVEMKPCEGGFEAALVLPAAPDGESE